MAASDPLEFTASRITDSASCPGGEVPLPGAGEMPLPEVTKIRPDPSDITPPPPSQMPASLSLTPDSSVHRVIALVVTFTPDTNPA